MTKTDRMRGMVVGVRVDPVSMDAAVSTILDWTADRQSPRVAIGVNAHVCNLASSDIQFRRHIEAADLSYADGQSIVWAARLLGIPVEERVATTDLVHPLMAACAAAGKRVFLFGGKPGVAQLAAERLLAENPGLSIRTNDGYVKPDEMGSLLESIAGHRTDVLLVGLGDPLQQEWIARHRDRLDVAAILSCGGLFDWISGQNKRAPRWMIRAGLEWLWRLIIEPRRLARRYLVGNPAFLARLGLQYLRAAFRRS